MSRKWLWLTIGVVVLVALAPAAAEVVYSDGWVPPLLVDGMWVTSGVSDEVAKQEAAMYNEGKTRDEVRQIEWDAYWQWHWEEEGAPEWAMRRGGKMEKRGWQRYYANQQGWGPTGLGQYGQPSDWSTQLLGYPQTFSTPLSLGYSPTVYITRTGEKYHKAGCQYLRQSSIPISLSDARQQGYTPCSKCY